MLVSLSLQVVRVTREHRLVKLEHPPQQMNGEAANQVSRAKGGPATPGPLDRMGLNGPRGVGVGGQNMAAVGKS